MCRNRPDVGNIFTQCLHLLRQYFVPLPWRFLTQPELQQGSDRLNCNQRHFLMLLLYKLIVYTSMNKLRAYFRVICAPIRSWSNISAQHFSSLSPGELCFWRPEILCPLINMYQLKILPCTSHLVTMSAMPPVDNYISIYILIEKPWQALDIKIVGVYHVQMWKWRWHFYGKFLEHVEC